MCLQNTPESSMPPAAAAQLCGPATRPAAGAVLAPAGPPLRPVGVAGGHCLRRRPDAGPPHAAPYWLGCPCPIGTTTPVKPSPPLAVTPHRMPRSACCGRSDSAGHPAATPQGRSSTSETSCSVSVATQAPHARTWGQHSAGTCPPVLPTHPSLPTRAPMQFWSKGGTPLRWLTTSSQRRHGSTTALTTG